MPAFGGADRFEIVHRQTIASEPRQGFCFDDVVDLAHAVSAFAVDETFPRRGAILEEVFFPKRSAAEDAAGAALHGHFDLFLVSREIDAGAKQHPRLFAGGAELFEVVAQLSIAVDAEIARELSLVNVAMPAQLTGRFDDRLRLAPTYSLLSFFSLP